MNTKDVLIAARKKIERPECWTKGAFARADSFGKEYCWCAVGAIVSVGGSMGVVRELRMALPTEWYGEDAEDFNDDDVTTHADVLALFDRAIAAQDGA